MNVTDKLEIVRFINGKYENVLDLMVNEVSFKLLINDDICKEFLCSPSDLYELVVGHLYCQSYIYKLSDIKSISIDSESFVAKVSLFDTINEEKKIIDNSVRFKSSMILENQERFFEESTLQKATAGVHRCALCSDEGTLFAFEDISRHNAFDKVIGYALKEGVALSDKYIITSGRIPLDMMRKATNSGIPMVVSRSTPTIAAVKEARENGLILLGFSKGDRFNIYSGYQSII